MKCLCGVGEKESSGSLRVPHQLHLPPLSRRLTSDPQGQPRPSDTVELSFLTWNEPQAELRLSSAATVSACWTLTLPAPDSPGLLSALHSLPAPHHSQTSICSLDAINPCSHPRLVPSSPVPNQTAWVTNVILTAGLQLLFYYPPFQPNQELSVAASYPFL